MVTGTSPSWTTVILVWIATFFVGFLTNFALIHYFPEQTRSIRKALKSFGSSVSGHMPQGQPAAHVGQMVSNPVTVLTRKVQPRASIGSSKSDGEAERASKDAKVSRKKDDTSSDKLRVPKIKLSGSHSKNGHDREHTRSRSRKPTTEEGGESKKVKSERSHEKRHRVRSEDNTVHSSGKKKLHH
ncbi:hypothetical protein FOL47_010024 [Perkinsus chesapeaki]|uniref:Uncharacterized protein n=1 Tax=Perkinsus chesapeaki TaxID=330153 RepID=A0A7J6L591_PERCH|nr:hypothetical protein FOL47_010024 [Perkinsus chesapeaki]